MPSRARCHCAFIAFALAFIASPAWSQTGQSPADAILHYENQVKPILEARCYRCHGTDRTSLKSEFSLASRVGILRGGAHGPAIDTGDPANSLILRAISYADDVLRMPPDGKLSEQEIDVINQWIEVGAPFGGDDDDLTEVAPIEHAFELSDEDRAWWSLQPLVRPAPPAVGDDSWPVNDIDRFILSRLEAAGLDPAAPADKAQLIRRATYDLTGLPPTIEEVDAFVADDEPDAYERLINRLLDSPQYGVKWGRHWLDLVRFAETDSYERDRLKPGAWRYRDWVIDALNSDMPYDEFLMHQLAGDELDQVTADSIIATGYMRLGIWDDEPTDTALAQYDDLDSILDTTSRVMLGVSMGCARCHDHKGDPIPQRDYYRMLSFFHGIAPYKVGGGNAPTPANYVDRIPADLGQPGADDAMIEWREQRTAKQEELQEIIAWFREKADPAAAAAAASESGVEGLVAHLPFEDESVTNATDVVGEFDGRINHVINGVEGMYGRCFGFDGDDDFIEIDRPVSEDFTISLWFRTTDVAPGGDDLRWFLGAGLVDGEISGVVRDFGVSLIGNGHVAAGTGAPERFVSSGEGFNDGAWHHVAFTRDMEDGRIALYVDGEQVDTSRRASREPLDATDVLAIGRMRPGYGNFKGEIDEVRFYDRVLDDRAVFDLFLAGGTPYSFNKLVQAVAPERAEAFHQAVEELQSMHRPEREMIRVLRVKEVDPTPQTHVLIRGNPHAPAERVIPGYPMILDEREPVLPEPLPDWETSHRRITLANWITDPENVRTARVMANRLWQYHFGRGLVRTPNDFGHFGDMPTHPDLLDWLASEFIERGWSMKDMHRLIMNSRAYRMSSRGDSTALALDPQNDLFWRFDMRRLTAEEIRDSMLAANGTINLEMGGPGVYPPMPPEVLATSSTPDSVWGQSPPDQVTRRSVYIHLKRSLLNPLLETFDLADTDATCPVRFVTTQPTQALTMLNSDFLNEQAVLLATRSQLDAGPNLDARIGRVIELMTSRRATDEEIQAGVEFIEGLIRDEEYDDQQAFDMFCLLALNLNEFVYLD